MPDEEQIFDLSRCPHPLSEEFILMDDDLFYECDKYEEYTERATAVSTGQKINSTIPCECITNEGNYCGGTVKLKRLDLPKKIQWECQKCGDRGSVINFEDTYWDLSSLPAKEKEQYLNQEFDDFGNFEEFDNDLWADNPLAADLDLVLQDLDDEGLQKLFNLPSHRFYPQFFEEIMGLSEDAFAQLFSGNWTEAGAPLYIRDDVPFEALRHSLFLQNARTFLRLLAEQESFETTQAGNLKRKTVDQLLEECRWPEGYLEKINTYNKVVNEQDAWLLHTIRILLDLAGLIREQKGAFRPVKKRLHLLEKEHAGELFQRLFYTYFVKMNMAYHGSDFAMNIQDGLPYSFYRLHQYEAKWASPELLYEWILLPVDQLEMKTRFDDSSYNPGVSTLEFSLLKPLVHFGVMEERQTDTKDLFGLNRNSEFRKTTLFDRIITFNIQ